MIPSFTSPYTRANNSFRRSNIERRLGMNQQLNAWRQTPLLDQMRENQPQPIQPKPEASQAGPTSQTSSIDNKSTLFPWQGRPQAPVGTMGAAASQYQPNAPVMQAGMKPQKGQIVGMDGRLYNELDKDGVAHVGQSTPDYNRSNAALGGSTWMSNPIKDGTLYNTQPREFTMGGGKTEGMVINGRPGGREPGTGYRPSPSSYQPNEKNKLDSIYAGGGMSGFSNNPYSNSGYVDPFEPNSAFNAKTGSYFWRGK